ncbi:MAG TPA: roadblock/LC7 domain-containing protein [Acidimicrobiia bacterium]|nr:roadblock/LC7 domain-containing protein [Acidimicrobiia bacterium]
MQTLSSDARNLNWLVASFVERVPSVTEAVVVSSDGLLIAMSDGFDRASGDRLAAVAAGLISIARGAGQPMNAGAVSQIIIEMERALLLVMCISDGSALAVTATRPCDIGLVAYEMALLVEKAGPALTPRLVAELKASLPQ